jgi:hypothetical protein
MTETLPTLLIDKVDWLIQERRVLIIEWIKYYEVTQKQIIDESILTKTLVRKFMNNGVFEPWVLPAVENTVLDILEVGPIRYVYHTHPILTMEQAIEMYGLRDSQICMPWQQPSDPELCIHLKLP